MIKSIKFMTPEVDLTGVIIKVFYSNGWGASIVKAKYSYGGPEGLWELAVLDSTGNINYDNPFTDDVLGHLNDTELEECLNNIASW